MCSENQRAHLQSARFWDCWQRARILGFVCSFGVFFFNYGKWQLSWPRWYWSYCYQVDLQHNKKNWYTHQCKLKIFFTVRNIEVIWSSQLKYVLRDIINQPWKLSCENLQCFLPVVCRGQMRKGQMRKGAVTLLSVLSSW